MAKLQVIIDDKLMANAKMFAAENGISLKELVSDLLSKHLSTTSTTSIKESNDTFTTKIITEERVAEMIQAALAQFKESNDTSIKESNDKIIIENKKEPIPVIETLDPAEEQFYYETRIDGEGNEYKVRLVKPEYLYGKIEEPGTKFHDDYDPNDPIEVALRELERG